MKWCTDFEYPIAALLTGISCSGLYCTVRRLNSYYRLRSNQIYNLLHTDHQSGMFSCEVDVYPSEESLK